MVTEGVTIVDADQCKYGLMARNEKVGFTVKRARFVMNSRRLALELILTYPNGMPAKDRSLRRIFLVNGRAKAALTYLDDKLCRAVFKDLLSK